MTSLSGSSGLITADDQTIRDALRDAHLPSLLPAVAQATGDISILRPDLAPDTSIWTTEPDGMPLPAQAAARELIFSALTRFRDAGCPTRKTSRPIGTSGSSSSGPGPAASWPGSDCSKRTSPFVIFEKNSEVGGAWWENSYPGARVDSPNHLYSSSFAQRPDWPSWYSTQSVLLDYFRDCVDEFGLRGNIRFGTEVESATYDQARSIWAGVARTSAGTERVEAQAVISAVGQLNRPLIPDFPGRDSFAGHCIPLGAVGARR